VSCHGFKIQRNRGTPPLEKICTQQGERPVFRSLILSFSLVLMFIASGVSGADAASGAGGDGNVTVLIYHRFDDRRYPSTSVPRERFHQQMAWLLARGYRVMGLDQLADLLAKGRSVPEKAVVITIDDGYRSVYDVAWPVLKSFGFPFSVFIYVKAVEKGYGDFMSWDQLREMQAAGVIIGNHSYYHTKMNEVPRGYGPGEYRAWVSSDLVKSGSLMMKRLGDSPRFFAIPYGAYNQLVLDEARKAGYDAVLTQDAGSVSSHTDRFRIPREPILGEQWSSMAHFETVLRRRDLPLARFSPPPGRVVAPIRFEAEVRNPQLYRPGDFQLYVSELGWKRLALRDGRISFDFAGPFSRRFNRVILRGRRKSGEIALSTWFIGPCLDRNLNPLAVGGGALTLR